MDDVKNRIRDALQFSKTMRRVAPENHFWAGRADGLNLALEIIALAESGESIDLADAMTPEELAEVET